MKAKDDEERNCRWSSSADHVLFQAIDGRLSVSPFVHPLAEQCGV